MPIPYKATFARRNWVYAPASNLRNDASSGDMTGGRLFFRIIRPWLYFKKDRLRIRARILDRSILQHSYLKPSVIQVRFVSDNCVFIMSRLLFRLRFFDVRALRGLDGAQCKKAFACGQVYGKTSRSQRSHCRGIRIQDASALLITRLDDVSNAQLTFFKRPIGSFVGERRMVPCLGNNSSIRAWRSVSFYL